MKTRRYAQIYRPTLSAVLPFSYTLYTAPYIYLWLHKMYISCIPDLFTAFPKLPVPSFPGFVPVQKQNSVTFSADLLLHVHNRQPIPLPFHNPCLIPQFLFPSPLPSSTAFQPYQTIHALSCMIKTDICNSVSAFVGLDRTTLSGTRVSRSFEIIKN